MPKWERFTHEDVLRHAYPLDYAINKLLRYQLNNLYAIIHTNTSILKETATETGIKRTY